MRIKKRASKRLGTKQREKVKGKVREHHRKSKREAKRDPTWRTKKKVDPGIPNSFPYKEQLLDEIQQRRVLAEQQRLEAREAARSGKGQEQADAALAAAAVAGDVIMAAAAEVEAAAKLDAAVLPVQYDGSLTAFLSGEGQTADVSVAIMLLDARDPLSWRVQQVEEALTPKPKKGKKQASARTLIYGVTHADLVPREQLAAWCAHLEDTQGHKVFALCSPIPSLHGRPARIGGGIEALVAYLETTLSGTKAKAKPAVAVLGIESAGRTSLASILAPALPNYVVFDTPALISASAAIAHDDDVDEGEEEEEEEEDEAALQQRDRDAAHRVLIRNAGAIFKVREPLPLIDALLARCAHPADLMMAHNTPAFSDANDFLVGVARSAGRLKKGSLPDTTAAARTILHQWTTGTLGYYAKPPSAPSASDDVKGATAHKARVAAWRETIEADASLRKVTLPRKEWRVKWQGKEVRLTSGHAGMLGTGKVAFVQARDDEDSAEEDDDDDEDDEDVEFEEEEEEDDDDDENEEEDA